MSQTVRDYLARKDVDADKFIPSAYKMSAQEAKQVLFMQSEKTRYELNAAAGCLKPCFTNYESPVVS